MNLVDKQHIARLKIGHQGRNVAGLFQNGPAGGFQLDTHFLRNNAGERGLAKARRAKDQGMVERFPAATRRREEDLHLLPHRTLPNVLIEPARSDRAVHRVFAMVAMAARVSRDKTIRLDHRCTPCCTAVILSPLRQYAVPA